MTFDRDAWLKKWLAETQRNTEHPNEIPTEERERAVLAAMAKAEPGQSIGVGQLRTAVYEDTGHRVWLAHGFWLADYLSSLQGVEVSRLGRIGFLARVTNAPELAAQFESDEMRHE